MNTAERLISSINTSEVDVPLVVGTSCMILEELEAPLEERVTASCLVKTKDGKLIDPETGKSIDTMLAENNVVDLAEKRASKRTEENTGDAHKIDLWLSPSHPLRSKEARCNVCVTYTEQELLHILPDIEKILKNKEYVLEKIQENGNAVVMYAFPSKFSDMQCVELAQKLIRYSRLENPSVTTPEQLRVTPLVFQATSESWPYVLYDLGMISQASLKTVISGKVFNNREKANIISEKLKDEFIDEYTIAGEQINERTKVVNKIRERASDYGYRLSHRSSGCPTSGRSFDAYVKLTETTIIFYTVAEREADKFKYIKKGICNKCKEIKMVCPPPFGCRWCRGCTVKYSERSLHLAA